MHPALLEAAGVLAGNLVGGPDMEHSTPLAEALAFHHAHGLDSRYDDVIEVADADATDRAQLAGGHHYHYGRQEWVDGHDHAHMASCHPDLPLLFCGTDAGTCYGGQA